MEFFVYSRKMIELIKPHEVPHVIVSITTPGDPKGADLPVCKHTLGVLRLQFHDTNDEMLDARVLAMEDPATVEHYVACCVNRSHARQILDLVAAHPTAEHFIVHCDAGMSRSPAIAAAISKIVLGDDANFFKWYHPNTRVYRMILEEHAAE